MATPQIDNPKSPKLGGNVARFNARLKVTGQARCGSDRPVQNPAYAYLATSPKLFPLESAMDELAYALNIDPVELRRVNGTLKEPIKDLPYTSQSLMKCFDVAAKSFGWARRNPKPGSMREGDWLIGWGCAAALYPTRTPLALTGGAKLKDRIQFAFGAQFVEVRVHERTREIRVPRIVGAYAAGKIVSPRTAEIDPRSARYYNDDLAEYPVLANIDFHEVEVIFVSEEDHAVDDLGMNAAVANAVFHATGKRIRALPIRMENMV